MPLTDRLAAILRQPERLLLALGGVLLIVGSLQPWAVGTTPGGQPLSVRPTGGLGEGAYLIFAGFVLIALAATRLVVDTTNRVLQLMPALLALLTGVMWLNANRITLNAIAEWQFSGGSGAQLIGQREFFRRIRCDRLAAMHRRDDPRPEQLPAFQFDGDVPRRDADRHQATLTHIHRRRWPPSRAPADAGTAGAPEMAMSQPKPTLGVEMTRVPVAGMAGEQL